MCRYIQCMCNYNTQSHLWYESKTLLLFFLLRIEGIFGNTVQSNNGLIYVSVTQISEEGCSRCWGP
jgi:hypothetical protein